MCEIYNQKDHEKIITWPGCGRIPPGEKVLVKCDGKNHIWKDCSGYDFSCRCPDLDRDITANKTNRTVRELKTFQNFLHKPNDFRIEIEKIKKFMNSDEYKTLFLIGDNGTGKSHLAEAMVYELIKRRVRVEMFSSTELGEIFRAYATENVDHMRRLNYLYENEYVIIDDLNREKKSEYFEAELSQFLDKYRGKLVITTNGPIVEMGYDYRIISRLHDRMTQIEFVGKDYRRIK